MIQWIIIVVLIIWVSILTLQVQSLRRSKEANYKVMGDVLLWQAVHDSKDKR